MKVLRTTKGSARAIEGWIYDASQLLITLYSLLVKI
jgi:hypothetical protein